jgi:hypothetical protein
MIEKKIKITTGISTDQTGRKFVPYEQRQILKHPRKKFLHRQEFTNNNIGKKMAPTIAFIFSGP